MTRISMSPRQKRGWSSKPIPWYWPPYRATRSEWAVIIGVLALQLACVGAVLYFFVR